MARLHPGMSSVLAKFPELALNGGAADQLFGLKAFRRETPLTWFAGAAAFRVMDGCGKPA